MKTCNISIDNELGLLERYELTPNELFVIRLLLLAKSEATQHYLLRFLQANDYNKQLVRDCLCSLQKKGVILQSYKIPKEGEAFAPSQVLFSQNFDRNFEKASFDMGNELMQVYPMFGNVNGALIPIRTVSKHFNSLEDAYRFYGKSIRYNQEKHNHIIELVKWAVENTDIINCSFSSFLINQFWLTLEAVRDGDQGNINFESVRLL